MIYIRHKRSSLSKLQSQFPDAAIFDLTSKSADPQLVKLSPFYPHGGIPIPFSPGATACCVEGIWQGLKVFQYAGIDQASFGNSSMKNLKRTARQNGLPRGHQKGLYSRELLDYKTARELIYLPVYKWVLDHVPAVQPALNLINQAVQERVVILLDYNINCNYQDLSRPLSHAGLVMLYLEGRYPQPWLAAGERPIVDDKVRLPEGCTAKATAVAGETFQSPPPEGLSSSAAAGAISRSPAAPASSAVADERSAATTAPDPAAAAAEAETSAVSPAAIVNHQPQTVRKEEQKSVHHEGRQLDLFEFMENEPQKDQ